MNTKKNLNNTKKDSKKDLNNTKKDLENTKKNLKNIRKDLKYRIYYADLDATVDIYTRDAFYREILIDMIEHRTDSKITFEEKEVLERIIDRLNKCKKGQILRYKG